MNYDQFTMILKELRLTKKDFAEIAKVSVTTIYNWNKRKYIIPEQYSQIVHILRVLKKIDDTLYKLILEELRKKH